MGGTPNSLPVPTAAPAAALRKKSRRLREVFLALAMVCNLLDCLHLVSQSLRSA